MEALAINLLYPTRCQACGRIMRVGTEAARLSGSSGEYIHSPDCPPPSKARGQNHAQTAELWVATCRSCGVTYGGRGEQPDPFYCNRCSEGEAA